MIKKSTIHNLVLIYLLLMIFNPTLAQDKTKLPPEATEFYEPVPPLISPGGSTNTPSSDAIVLFDGTRLSAWESVKDGSEAGWTDENGILTVKPGSGDIQIDLEWRGPFEIKGEGQGRGNSGLYIMNKYELLGPAEYQGIPNYTAHEEKLPTSSGSRGPG